MAKNTSSRKKPTTKSPEWSDLNEYDILLASKNGRLYLGKEQLSEVDLKNLQAEVKALKNFKLWAILQETLRHKAIEKGVIQSESWEHTLAAKMMLHSLGIMRSIVNVIEKTVYPQPSGQPQKRAIVYPVR